MADDLNTSLKQLLSLRQSLQNATVNHFRRQLSITLPTDQVNRILDHPNVSLELNRLIHQITLSPHDNLNSLSFQLAKSLTQIAEPHVRLAVNLSTNNSNTPHPEDVLQEIIRSNSNVNTSYNPISDSLKPSPQDGHVSKLYQQLESPLIVDARRIPTLKPEVDKIVALGSIGNDVSKQQQISDNLHQDLLAEVLTHQQPSAANTNQLVKSFLQKHGLNTNQIDQNSFNQFVNYVNHYQEIISFDDRIITLQTIAEAKKLTGSDLQTILRQSGQTPESLIREIKTTPVSPEMSSNKKVPPSTPLSPPPKDIKKAIDQADKYDYSNSQTTSKTGFLRRIFRFFRQFRDLSGSPEQNWFSNFQTGFRTFIDNVRTMFSSSSSGGLGNRGTSNNVGFGQSLGNFAQNGLSQAGQALGGAAKEGARAAVKAATQAAKAAMQAFGKIASQFAAKALLLNPYFWLAVIIIILLAAVLYIVAGASPQKIALIQTDTISGDSGGGLVAENPYIGGNKQAKPNRLEDPIGAIEYTYTIIAKQGVLTNIAVSDQLTITQKAGGRQIDITPPTPPETIDTSWTSPPFSFNLAGDMDDAAIINTITIQATADGSPQQATFIATTLIGTPPTGCYLFAEPPAPEPKVTAISWTSSPDSQSKEVAAAATIIGSIGSSYSTLCSSPIKLYLASAGLAVDYGGWFLGSGNIALDYKKGSVGSQSNALYTLAHESGHAFDERSGISASAFRQSGLVSWSGNSCVNNLYPFPNYLTQDSACYSENFAEGFARYINPQAAGALSSAWQTWFKNNVFK